MLFVGDLFILIYDKYRQFYIVYNHNLEYNHILSF